MTDLSKFKDIFISEVEDQLQKLNDNLLLVEKEVNEGGGESVKKDVLNELMRASHTIKGSSASMGYVKLAFLAHVMEDVFDSARNDKLVITEEIINHVFVSIDNIEKSINSIKDKNEEIDFDEFSHKFKGITGVETAGIGKSQHNNAETTQTKAPENNKPVEPEKEKNKTEENTKKDTKSDEIVEAAISKIDYIKVPVKRLDLLLDLVEELLIDKMRIEQLSDKFIELKEISEHINLLISRIQYEVMESRLVPVEQVFARFPRMIRDLSQKQKKEISFEITGGEIELDRTVVDKLGEPLIHLLRNAVDHGIGNKGTIKLQAQRQSEHVIFVVENDEHGIDLERVKATAIKKGLVSSHVASTMSEQSLINFLFDPNFSTNDVVTEISGRGVGLSVVKKFIESFGGRVMVENYPDRAKFILELPLTLAIIETLLVKVKSAIFAIPFANVDRSVKVSYRNIKRMADHNMAVVDGRNVPLVDLKDVFQMAEVLSGDKDVAKNPIEDIKEDVELSTKGKDALVVLVKKGTEIGGIVVDSIVSEQEIIVKPFSSVLKNIKSFSGSTILGNGKVVLILDVVNLLKKIK